jgi:predicted dinucleotide-utilizing enzyme
MLVESKNRNETDIISDQNYIAQLKHFSDDDITFDRLVFMNGKGKRVTDPIESIGKANAARIVQCVNEYDVLIETIASLRAEKAELIEALRDARTVLYMCENSLLNCGYGVESSTIKSIQKTFKTLSKY